jgi:hypothetical protein
MNGTGDIQRTWTVADACGNTDDLRTDDSHY